MHPLLKKLEHLTDRIIPYLLVLLTIIIVLEFGFKHIAEQYNLHITIADYTIIFFFVLDLAYKYNRVRQFKPFVKKFWLDIIAVFPFFLVFRIVEELFLLLSVSQDVAEGQKFLHFGLEAEKIVKEESALKELSSLQKESRFIKEIESGTKLTRTSLFARFFRLPRMIKVLPFYEKPIKKEVKIIEKDVGKETRLLEKDVKNIENFFRKRSKSKTKV